jgi:AAA+ ATPase superfamily predicted ATPase
MPKINPFTYGTVVTGVDFANRKKELRELSGKLKETVRIFLVAPRRYGKTSLIQNVLGRLKRQKMLTAYVDLYWATSSREFMELYLSHVIRGSKSLSKKAAHFLRDFLPRVRPHLGFDPNGNPELSLGISGEPPAEAAEEVFNMPEKIAKDQGKRFVVVLDEFQEFGNFNGGALERQLRAAIQHHNNVSYLFAGSKPHMLIDMVSEKTRPFYQMGTLMTLDKMPHNEFRSFIESKFLKSGKKISPDDPPWTRAGLFNNLGGTYSSSTKNHQSCIISRRSPAQCKRIDPTLPFRVRFKCRKKSALPQFERHPET